MNTKDCSGDPPADVIVERLLETRALEPADCTMVVGRRPASLPTKVAGMIRKMVCMDASEKELEELRMELAALELTNVERYLKKWDEYVPHKGYDSCLSCSSGYPGDAYIERMDGTACRNGILVCRESGPCIGWLQANGRDFSEWSADGWHVVVWRTGERRAGNCCPDAGQSGFKH